MRQYTVLFNANVLYPAPMRDALMQLAVTDLLLDNVAVDLATTVDDADNLDAAVDYAVNCEILTCDKMPDTWRNVLPRHP